MINLVRNALTNLKGHKLRVFIAIVWIVIGITSVVVVSSIGNGLEAEVKKSVSQISENKTTISFETEDYGAYDVNAFLKPFAQKDIEALSFLEGVEKIGASVDGYDMQSNYYGQATFDKKTAEVEIAPNEDNISINPIYGRNFSLDDENRRVIIITLDNATQLFNKPENAIGKGISINGATFEVIGVIDVGGAVNNENKEEEAELQAMYGEDMGYVTSYAPEKAVTNLSAQFTFPSEIYALDIIAKKGYDVYEVAYSAIDKLTELHPDINGTYTTPDQSDQANELEMMTSQINKFVGIIVVIAMVVGGVGVMNIMYVSVMERQREIGIRRAIGAKPRTILFQFLVEATVITVMGGILGMIIGFFAIDYVGGMIGFKPIPTVSSFVYASLTTILTGILFGMVPAIKAARLDPIKAIYK
ncbi:MAG: FtsX-like permease family protein [Terrisporobacter sp.]|uniref:ABC transporter permease n=1 Tax=Terrisporobacter sp. TaxID=1965305 RepID=UPI002FC71FD3